VVFQKNLTLSDYVIIAVDLILIVTSALSIIGVSLMMYDRHVILSNVNNAIMLTPVKLQSSNSSCGVNMTAIVQYEVDQVLSALISPLDYAVNIAIITYATVDIYRRLTLVYIDL